MSAVDKEYERVRTNILSAHENTSTLEKVNFYNSWAKNYDHDVAVLEYRAPSLAANTISTHFNRVREESLVLDVACGTGLVAKQMKKCGFGHFVGVDGSKAMLELARESGLYQNLKQRILGEDPLPAEWADMYDVVVIVGGLSVGQVPVDVVRELCRTCKSGGFVCMTTRCNQENLEYKEALEKELKKMEKEGLWTCEKTTEVEVWEKGVSEEDVGYIPGVVFLYRKL